MGDNARGALIMMAAMAAFTFNDTLIKTLSGQMPLFQVLVLRGVGTVVAFALIAWWKGVLRPRLTPRDARLVALRSASEVGAAYFFLTALFNMPLANATAILQALPLAVTLAGALFLGEPLGWRRMAAIAVGFVGVLLIVRPGTEGFNGYSLMALASVACVTVRDLLTRQMSAAVPSLFVALATAVGVLAFASAASTTVVWVPVTSMAILVIAGATCFIILGYLFSVATMRIGDLSFVAPFRYSGLLWALLLGLAVFGEWPSALTLVGAAIVVATGVFTFYRERRLARRPVVQPQLQR